MAAAPLVARRAGFCPALAFGPLRASHRRAPPAVRPCIGAARCSGNHRGPGPAAGPASRRALVDQGQCKCGQAVDISRLALSRIRLRNTVQLLLLSLVWIVGVPALAACLYLLGLTLLSAELPLLPPSKRKLRFDVIVPAHNEESVIAAAVASLKSIDWPQDQFRCSV